MKKDRAKCPKCGYTYIDTCGSLIKVVDGYIYGSMYGKEIKLADELPQDAHDYAKKITSRVLCDFCSGTGLIDVPVREHLRANINSTIH